MRLLSEEGVNSVFHYSPLHYLVFIARAAALLGKTSLGEAGFGPRHFRSTSSKRDVARGFSEYAHLTLGPQPQILESKLAAGFPHIAITVPANAIEVVQFSLAGSTLRGHEA